MKPTLEWLKNPEIFEVNREKAHSDHLCTVNGQQLKQSLNGTWKFNYCESPDNRPADFYMVDFDVTSFDEIKVPGHIQLQGYDKPQYVNTQYPWEGQEKLLPPQIPQKRNPVGSYVKFFDIDKALIGKDTYISFQGVETAIYVWLNGEFVGYSEDSFTPSEFSITPYLKEKNNKLAVEVYRYSTASWLEDQDFWRFNLNILIETFLTQHRESDQWDVKEEWHENSADLIKDIICFANTIHDKDCYIIFGVNDELKVCGMQNKRYKQSDILDTLSNLQFAGDIVPQIELKTISMQSSYAPYDVVDVDVLIIYNTNMTPIYLKKRYGEMIQGCIYSRIGDKNTQNNGNSDMGQIEMLWRKRLGLTKPPFEYIMDSLSRKLEWREYKGSWYNIYKPEYVVRNNWDVDNQLKTDDFYSYSQVNESTHFYTLEIIVNNTVLEEYQTVSLDGGRLLVPVPELGVFSEWNKSDEKYYRYYIEENDRYVILKFLYNPENSEQRIAYDNLLKIVLIYKSDDERISFESYVKQSYSDFVRRIESCNEFDNIGAGDPYRTMVYKQQLRVGAVLNEMLKEYREMINGNSSNFE